MLEVLVNITDSGAMAALERLRGDMEAKAELHEAMAQGTGELVRTHLQGLNSRSPNTQWWAKAADSVESSWDAERGMVRITRAGAALRYYGGRVEMKDRFLALPTADVPVRGGERMRPGEMADLAFLPAKKGAAGGTRGYLLEGMQVPKKDGGTRTVPKPDGKLFFTLREFTDHPEDPSVLPELAELQAAAGNAALDYLAAAAGEGGRA